MLTKWFVNENTNINTFTVQVLLSKNFAESSNFVQLAVLDFFVGYALSAVDAC